MDNVATAVEAVLITLDMLGSIQTLKDIAKRFRKVLLAHAQYKLGVMYKNGRGVQQDNAKAVEWYRKAAEQGHANAQYKLGVMYKNGSGVQQDNAMVVEWYSKAAEQGHANAQNELRFLMGPPEQFVDIKA